MMAVALSITCIGGSVSAASYSESTSEFGTFKATLNKSGRTATATTKTTKVASSIYCNVEIQYNSTGETIDYDENTESNDTYVTSRVTNYKSFSVAVFSCHEARGNGSVVKYFADVI